MNALDLVSTVGTEVAEDDELVDDELTAVEAAELPDWDVFAALDAPQALPPKATIAIVTKIFQRSAITMLTLPLGCQIKDCDRAPFGVDQPETILRRLGRRAPP